MITSQNESSILPFSVYKQSMKTDTNTMFTAQFIVQKNQYGLILNFTELELFAQPYSGRLSERYDYSREHHLVYITMALNYFFKDCGISSIRSISPEMVIQFLSLYIRSPQANGNLRSTLSIGRCINVISTFFANLYLYTEDYDPESLMVADFYKVNAKSERVLKKYRPVFEYKKEVVSDEPIFRDIPIAAMDIILEQSLIWNKHIYFLILCQILTGLRPSEALNLRQETSPKGSSFKYTIVNGNITDIAIDLRREYQMRADGKSVGGIKKPRIHHIYPDYVPVFMDGYTEHLAYLCTQKCDSEYMPLFPDRNGNAMTYSSYRHAFQKLIKEHVLPVAEKSDNIDVRVFASRLKTENLGPHALRHFYTVNLTLKGLDIGQIQMYRGDKDPTSALTYVNGKGEIIRKVQKANEDANTGLMEIGKKALENVCKSK